jgi:hypothetical protein
MSVRVNSILPPIVRQKGKRLTCSRMVRGLTRNVLATSSSVNNSNVMTIFDPGRRQRWGAAIVATAPWSALR